MPKTVTIGRKLIPLDCIMVVEPFDPAEHPDMSSERAFKARVVLCDRQSVLMEETVEAFSKTYGFRILEADHVALNEDSFFTVETFSPRSGFEPGKPYRSRLIWRDRNVKHSKLLLSEPEAVVEATTNVRTSRTARQSLPRARSAAAANGSTG